MLSTCIGNGSEWESYGIAEHFLDPYVSLWCVICSPLSILLNLVVVLLILETRTLSASYNQTFVLLMTMGDLLFSCSYLATRWVYLCFPRALCGVYILVTSTSQMASVASLLSINCDKFINLVWPLRYHNVVTPTLVGVQVGMILLLILAGSVINYLLNVLGYFGPEFGYWDVPISDCVLKMEPVSYTVSFIIFYVVPNCVSLLISIYIFWLVHSKLTWIGPGGVEVPFAKKIKRILFCFSATMWQAVTFLLYRISYCFHSFYLFENECDSEESDEFTCPWSDTLATVTRIFLFLVPLGTLGNPIITIVTHKRYRQRLASLLKSCSKALVPQSHNSSDFSGRLKVETARNLRTINTGKKKLRIDHETLVQHSYPV